MELNSGGVGSHCTELMMPKTWYPRIPGKEYGILSLAPLRGVCLILTLPPKSPKFVYTWHEATTRELDWEYLLFHGPCVVTMVV